MGCDISGSVRFSRKSGMFPIRKIPMKPINPIHWNFEGWRCACVVHACHYIVWFISSHRMLSQNVVHRRLQFYRFDIWTFHTNVLAWIKGYVIDSPLHLMLNGWHQNPAIGTITHPTGGSSYPSNLPMIPFLWRISGFEWKVSACYTGSMSWCWWLPSVWSTVFL